jgi:hypothetical protein
VDGGEFLQHLIFSLPKAANNYFDTVKYFDNFTASSILLAKKGVMKFGKGSPLT